MLKLRERAEIKTRQTLKKNQTAKYIAVDSLLLPENYKLVRLPNEKLPRSHKTN